MRLGKRIAPISELSLSLETLLIVLYAQGIMIKPTQVDLVDKDWTHYAPSYVLLHVENSNVNLSYMFDKYKKIKHFKI